MYTLLCPHFLRWLGLVRRMADGRMPKDLLYGELATGSHGRRRTHLRYKVVCKCDMKACNINPDERESLAEDRLWWKHNVSAGLAKRETDICAAHDVRRSKRKADQCNPSQEPPVYICHGCNRECKSRIGLYSHTR